MRHHCHTVSSKSIGTVTHFWDLKWLRLKCRLSALTLRYTTWPKVCGQPFKCVDLAVSATPIAYRCIKLSTPPCNLHRQTLAVEWPILKSAMTFVIGCHLSNKSVNQISALLELPWSTVSAAIVKWKHLWATKAQPWSGRTQAHRTGLLKRVKNSLS